MSKRSDFWLFLRILPSMLLFQILVVATLIGILFGSWFYGKFVSASPEGSFSGVLYTVTVSALIIVYGCYRAYSAKGGIPSDYEAAVSSLKRELLVVLPLVVGAILAMYFLANGQITRIGTVLWPAIILWLILRLIFRKKQV
jgi:hypothetical protein